MKNVSVYLNETKEIVDSPKSQANFDSASKDEGSTEPMEKPFTPNEFLKKNIHIKHFLFFFKNSFGLFVFEKS
jgi:hypothetical protein